MKTQEQALADLQKKYANEQEAIKAKYEVLRHLPDLGEYAPPFVHYSPLYGSVGSLHFQLQRYSSIAEGKSPDTALLRRLLAQFPPTPLVKLKDACTSFRPEPETYINNGEYTDIDPVVIQVDPGISQSIEVKWYGEIDSRLWRFEVDFPLYASPRLGSLDLRFNYYGGHNAGEISSVERCTFTPHDKRAKTVRWASGSTKTPNSFTVYWERGHNADIPAMLDK